MLGVAVLGAAVWFQKWQLRPSSAMNSEHPSVLRGTVQTGNGRCYRQHQLLDTAREHGMLMNDPQAARDFTERASRPGVAKLDIPDRHLRELPQRFAMLLNLTDFWK